jgi:hypothetical protein
MRTSRRQKTIEHHRTDQPSGDGELDRLAVVALRFCDFFEQDGREHGRNLSDRLQAEPERRPRSGNSGTGRVQSRRRGTRKP